MTETAHTQADIHQEKVFEEHIVACFTREQGYIERVCSSHYDVALALDTELLFRFLKSTQPEAWKTLEGHYSTTSESEVLKRLEKALREQPTHVVLRDGLKLVPNIHFTLCYFKPASNLNPDLVRLFNANILSVMRQVKYSSKSNNAIDLVTFVNGIPVTTLEVKNLLTNPGSTLTNFVAVYVAAFEQYRGQIVCLDDLVQATVNANLATSSGHMGQEAIKRSTRKDRSRDGLYNQLKMYAELFRSLGWLRSTQESALNYNFTLLGEQVVAAQRQWKPLFEEGVLGIAYPSHVLELKGAHDIRPFSAILQTMLACNDGLSRDEMIVGPLNTATDRSRKDLSDLAHKVMSLRGKPEEVSAALDEVSAQRGIQINTLKNYTRWPLAVMRDLGWTVKDREPYRNSNRTFQLHRLTPSGKAQALRLRDTIDLRVDQVDQLPFDQKRALSRKAHFAILERAGFDLTHVSQQIQKDEGTVQAALRSLGLPKDKPILFSPFQSLSIATRVHHHAGIGLMTPDQIHFGQAKTVYAARQTTLDAAYLTTPERFVRKPPKPPKIPTAVWINPPKQTEETQA